MRKVKFVIDDIQYFKESFNLDDEQSKEMFNNKESFKVIFTIFGDGNTPDRYELTDYYGNKININSLNGYQRGVVLNDCYTYFSGGKTFEGNSKTPCGVVEIEETNI